MNQPDTFTGFFGSLENRFFEKLGYLLKQVRLRSRLGSTQKSKATEGVSYWQFEKKLVSSFDKFQLTTFSTYETKPNLKVWA